MLRTRLFGGRPEKKPLEIRAVGQPSLVAGPVFKTGEGQRELSLASSIPVLYRHFLSSLLQVALRAGARLQNVSSANDLCVQQRQLPTCRESQEAKAMKYAGA